MLNVHFDCAFREAQFGGDQLVGQAELQFRQNLFLTRREIDHASVESHPGSLIRQIRGRKPARIRRLEILYPVHPGHGQRPVGAADKNKAQASYGDLDR